MLLPYKNKKDDIIEKHVILEEKLLKLFEKCEVDYTKLLDILREMKELNIITREVLKLSITNNTEENENVENHILVKDREIDPFLLSEYQNLKEDMKFIHQNFEEDKVPNIDIDNIQKFINKFEETLLNKDTNDISFEQYEGKILIVSKTKDEIPLTLTNGKKTIFTSTNFDFSPFTYDELIEILRVLDLIVYDNRYDYIRSEITKHIASISSISSIIF